MLDRDLGADTGRDTAKPSVLRAKTLPSASVLPNPSKATSDDLADSAGQELANAALLAQYGSRRLREQRRCKPDHHGNDRRRRQAHTSRSRDSLHSEDMGSGDDDDLTDEQHASSALA